MGPCGISFLAEKMPTVPLLVSYHVSDNLLETRMDTGDPKYVCFDVVQSVDKVAGAAV
jgi:hypothetical protein